MSRVAPIWLAAVVLLASSAHAQQTDGAADLVIKSRDVLGFVSGEGYADRPRKMEARTGQLAQTAGVYYASHRELLEAPPPDDLPAAYRLSLLTSFAAINASFRALERAYEVGDFETASRSTARAELHLADVDRTLRELQEYRAATPAPVVVAAAPEETPAAEPALPPVQEPIQEPQPVKSEPPPKQPAPAPIRQAYDSESAMAERDDDSGGTAWPWVTLGLTVAAAGGTAYFAIQADSEFDSLKTTCAPACDPDNERLKTMEELETFGVVGLVTTGVLLTTTIILFATDGDESQDGTALLLGPGAVHLRGSF